MLGPRKHSKTIHSHTTVSVPVTRYEAHLNVLMWQFNTVAFPRRLSGSQYEIAVPTRTSGALILVERITPPVLVGVKTATS